MIWNLKFWQKKSLSDPTPEEFALFSGGASSGTVSIATALSVPAVASCVQLVAGAASSLGICVEKLDAETWVEDAGHPVAKLLADQPNEWTSTGDLVRDLVATALCYDRGAVAWVNRIGGEVREIVRYEPAHVTVDYSADGRLEPSYRVNNVPQPVGDIIHLRSPFTRSPISLASDAIAAAKAMETHAKRLFENGARPSGVLKTEAKLGDEAAKKAATAFKNAFVGAANSGKVPTLYDKWDFLPLVINSTDAQFLENRRFQILEICRAFRVPPSMIYDLDRATWSNGEQQGMEFLTYSLEPWLQALEGAMRRALFSADERGKYRVRFDRDDLTRADLTARATAISSLISAKVLNPNEGRSWLDLAPYDGGDSFENPHINPNAGAANAPVPMPEDQPDDEKVPADAGA